MAINESLTISVVGISIRIECSTRDLLEMLASNFEAMSAAADVCEIEYCVKKSENDDEIIVSRRGSEFHATARNTGELIYLLEGDLVVRLQLLRPDLLFLHAAVVSDGAEIHLFTGPSGAGKSTICWGLLHHGFHYLSDELAPIDSAKARVAAYSHALCMKSFPPPGYAVPNEAILTKRGIHIPPSAMPSTLSVSTLPIGSIFFVEYRSDSRTAAIERVGNAEAATRLYPNILNALAHGNDGLDAAVQLVGNARCYRLYTADLAESCALIKTNISS